MSNVPGVTAKHAIITDDCRSGRGESGAFDEAVDRLRAEYEELLKGWEGIPGVHFHLVLSLEQPADTDEREI